MNNMTILRAIGGIDDDLIARAGLQVKRKNKTFYQHLKWALPVAACLVLTMLVILRPIPGTPGVVPGGGFPPANGTGVETSSSAEEEPADDGLVPASLDHIFGLPAKGYTWGEGNGMEASDRTATNQLRLLMREFDSYDPDVKAAFAIVKVSGAEPFTETENNLRSEGQMAECGVEFDVLGDGLEVPVKIKQYLYGGCTNDEETNLLRVGGVYVLPLMNWQNEDFWTIYGDLDVLFEVDDKGMIQSHSRHEKLNKYDGMSLETLWNDIVYLYNNPIYRMPFAEYISNGYDVVAHSGRVAMHISYPEQGEWYGWEPEDAERFSADIDSDGKIAIATSGFNIFRAVEGMSMKEMENVIIRIQEFEG